MKILKNPPSINTTITSKNASVTNYNPFNGSKIKHQKPEHNVTDIEKLKNKNKVLTQINNRVEEKNTKIDDYISRLLPLLDTYMGEYKEELTPLQLQIISDISKKLNKIWLT